MTPLDVQFPLAADALPTLHVDAAQVQAWTRTAQAAVAGVIQNRDSWYFRGDELTGAYKLVFEQDSLRGYTRSSSATTSPSTSTPQQQQQPAAAADTARDFLCRGNVQLSLDDVAFALQSTTTRAFRSAQAQLFPDTFLDAAILYPTAPLSHPSPRGSASVKWTAYKPHSAAGLVAPRDVVYFEYFVTTRDADNRTVVVQYLQSLSGIDLQTQTPRSLTRAHVAAIHTFRLDAALGGSFVQSVGTFDPVGSSHMPAWVATKTLATHFRSLLQLSTLADARALVAFEGGSSSNDRAPRTTAASRCCSVCEKTFNLLLRTRIACRACRVDACKSCVASYAFYSAQRAAVVTQRFCLTCVMTAREQQRMRQTNSTYKRASGCQQSPQNSSQSSSKSIDSGATASIASDLSISHASYCSEDNDVPILQAVDDGRGDRSDCGVRQTTDRSAVSSPEAASTSTPLRVIRSTSSDSYTSKPRSPRQLVLLTAAVRSTPVSPVQRTRASHKPPSSAPTRPRTSNQQQQKQQHQQAVPHVAPAFPVAATVSVTSPVMHTTHNSVRTSAAGDKDAFAKMSESIAAQSLLLQQLQQSMSLSGTPPCTEAASPSTGHFNYASPPISPCNGSVRTSTDDDERFEILF